MASDELKLEQLKEKIKQELKAEILAEIAKGMKAEQEEPLNTGSNLEKPQKNEALTLSEAIIKAEIQKPKATTKEDITINAKTILKMASHAKKYANPKIPQHKWVEVLGILAGKFEDGILHIEDAYQMGHGNAIHAEIHDYKNYARAVTEINENGQFVCGWYHSHPTYGLFLSEEDMDTQRRYQKLWDKSVALVMDPYMIDGNSFGFEIFRSDFKKYFPCKFKTQGNLTPAELPELLEIINPILEGKNIYKEYDE